MRLLFNEFSLSSEITVQSASEMRASNTKTRKKKTNTKQIAVNRLIVVTCFFMFSFLVVFYFFFLAFSILYFAYSVQLVRLCEN